MLELLVSFARVSTLASKAAATIAAVYGMAWLSRHLGTLAPWQREKKVSPQEPVLDDSSTLMVVILDTYICPLCPDNLHIVSSNVYINPPFLSLPCIIDIIDLSPRNRRW